MKKRADGRYPSKVKLPSGEVKYVYGRTKEELQDKIDDIKLAHAMGATNINRKITVQDWAQKWWKIAKKDKTGASSQEGYISAIDNYIIPEIGAMKLIDVKLINVQGILNNMAETGRSESLQRKVLITLNAMFKYALKNGMLVSNPAQFAEICEVPSKRVEALTPAQAQELLTLCREWSRTKYSTRADRAELAIHMGMFLGLRRGEIIAAQWNDLDEASQTIHISRAVELTNNKPVNKDHTKTPAGNRVIPVPDHLWEMLKNTKKISIYIIPSAKGTQMSKSSFRKMMEPLQGELSFDFTFHQLRHTFATLLEKLGVSPKMCQYLLGHASEWTTKKIYTHVQIDYVHAIAPQLNNILNFSQEIKWESNVSQSEKVSHSSIPIDKA